MSIGTFFTSFFDGITGEGIFGDLRIPDVPARMFKPEPEEEEDTLLVIRRAPGVKVQIADEEMLCAEVQQFVSKIAGERVVVSVPEAPSTDSPHSGQ